MTLLVAFTVGLFVAYTCYRVLVTCEEVDELERNFAYIEKCVMMVEKENKNGCS